MRQMSRNQMRIIIALNFVIIVLLSGLFFSFPFDESQVNATPKDIEHQIDRSARISLNANLDFETNIGGSEDEELVACFASPNQTKLHIFGNTKSTDFDFVDSNQSKGIFFVITDRKAKIESIFTFGDQGDILKKVILSEGGYLLAVENTNSKTTHLLRVSYEGEIIRKLTHPSVSDEFVADIILLENGYMLIVHIGISLIDFYDIKVFFYSLDYKDEGAILLHNPSYSQRYLAVYPKGLDKFVMAVCYESDIWNGMSIIEFSKSSDSFAKIELENNYTPKGFMPYSGGYVTLVIDSNNRCSLIKLSDQWVLKEKKYLTTATTDAKLLYSNSNYYVYTKTNEQNQVFKFDSSLTAYDDMTFFKQTGEPHIAYQMHDGTIFLSSNGNIVLTTTSSTQNLIIELGSLEKEENGRLVFLGNDAFLICESNGNSADVCGNFGKKDIWLAKVAL